MSSLQVTLRLCGCVPPYLSQTSGYNVEILSESVRTIALGSFTVDEQEQILESLLYSLVTVNHCSR